MLKENGSIERTFSLCIHTSAKKLSDEEIFPANVM
jgi:hypothetical protein